MKYSEKDNIKTYIIFILFRFGKRTDIYYFPKYFLIGMIFYVGILKIVFLLIFFSLVGILIDYIINYEIVSYKNPDEKYF